MTQRTANTSLAVKLVTATILLATVGCLIASFHTRSMTFVAAALMLISLVCYLTAPVAYELSDDHLTVLTHVGSTTFGPITTCSRVERRIGWGLRLFGNGGLFAGTGFFWTPSLGIFRAYVTSARKADMLMVQTPQRKVLITPEDPDAFLAGCTRRSSP